MDWPLAFVTLFSRWPGRPAPVLNARLWARVSAALGSAKPPCQLPAEAAILLEDRHLRSAAHLLIEEWQNRGWRPLTSKCSGYPARLVPRLGAGAPPVLWVRGESLPLDAAWATVVGSRILSPGQSQFAFEAGRIFARQGFAVLSGGAKGSDYQGVAGCLDAGGFGCHLLAGGSPSRPKLASALLSEAPWEREFDRISALRRNRWVYAASAMSLVCASRLNQGGSWHGAVSARRSQLSRVVVFCPKGEASDGNTALRRLGIEAVETVAEFERLVENGPGPAASFLPAARLAV